MMMMMMMILWRAQGGCDVTCDATSKVVCW